jgi:hypothetical protein
MKSKTTQWAMLISVVVTTSLAPHLAVADNRLEFVAPEGLAVIVFIQNLREDRAMKFTVFDLNKQCIAEVGGRQAEVVPIKPGKHTLYITGYKTHRVEASLAAGRTYFVRLYTVEKIATRASAVTLVQRGSDAYKQFGTWLEGARVVHMSDDPCSGKPLKERTNRTQKRIDEANADWKEADDAQRADRMLIQLDGLTRTDLTGL